jgi:hypothetical protein
MWSKRYNHQSCLQPSPLVGCVLQVQKLLPAQLLMLSKRNNCQSCLHPYWMSVTSVQEMVSIPPPPAGLLAVCQPLPFAKDILCSALLPRFICYKPWEQLLLRRDGLQHVQCTYSSYLVLQHKGRMSAALSNLQSINVS